MAGICSDEWFDCRYIRVVPNADQAIAAATQQFIHQPINPALIRQKPSRG